MALLLADRDVLFTGDALVTRDPYTGRTGPRLVALARLAPSNNQLAVSSVSAQYRVADLGAMQLAVQAAQDVTATVTLDSWLEALSAARLQSH